VLVSVLVDRSCLDSATRSPPVRGGARTVRIDLVATQDQTLFFMTSDEPDLHCGLMVTSSEAGPGVPSMLMVTRR
jgi:hypothetical protein